jgi:hypothetical protein
MESSHKPSGILKQQRPKSDKFVDDDGVSDKAAKTVASLIRLNDQRIFMISLY